jgi:hypothetical protein
MPNDAGAAAATADSVGPSGDPAPIKISFMVAGVQKAGTTALYERLRRHPEIGMSKRKEPHFFDLNAPDWITPNYDILHRLYEPGRAVYGEATPNSLYSTPAHERIRAYNPDMKFILIFRDPIERAYSHWCMQFARGRESLPFGVAIRTEHERLQGSHRAYSYVERGFYAVQLEALRRVFPNSRMAYLMSQDLLDNRKIVFRRLGRLLGVDWRRFDFEQVFAKTRPRISYPSVVTDADREWLRGRYARDLWRFSEMTDLDISSWGSVTK